MPKLSNIYSKPEKITEPIPGDEDMVLSVSRDKITPKFLKELAAMEGLESEPERIEALVHYLNAVLVSWNLTDEKKKPIPLTRQSLEEMGLEGLMLLQGIITRPKGSDPNVESSPE